MEIVFEIFYQFYKPISIISGCGLLLATILAVNAIFFQQQDKTAKSIILVFAFMFLYSINSYSKYSIEKRPVIELKSIQDRFVGKTVKIDNEIKEIVSIQYDDFRKIDIKYKTLNKQTDVVVPATFFFYFMVLMMFVIFIFSIIGKIFE